MSSATVIYRCFKVFLLPTMGKVEECTMCYSRGISFRLISPPLIVLLDGNKKDRFICDPTPPLVEAYVTILFVFFIHNLIYVKFWIRIQPFRILFRHLGSHLTHL